MPRNDTRRVTTSRVGGGRLPSAPALTSVASISAPRPDNSASIVADQLMNLLGVGTRAYQMHAEERDRELATEGTRDALAGTVDPAKQKWQAYSDAANTVSAEAKAVRDYDELTEGARPFIENSDKAGLDAFVKQKFADLWGTADAAELNVVSPRWQKMHSELQAQLIATAKEKARVSDEANFMTVFDGAVRDRNVDFADLNGKARELFGAETPEVMSRVVAEMIDKHKAPWLLDQMPDEMAPGIPSVKNHPKYAAGLRGIAERATAELEKGRAAEREVEQNKVFAYVDNRIERQQWFSDKELAEGVELGHFTAEKASEIRRRQFAEQERLRKAVKEDYNLNSAFETGDWHVFKGRIPDEKINDAFDAYVLQSIAGQDQDQQLATTLSASARNGLVFRPLQSLLSNPNYENPERLTQQLAQYRSLFQVSAATARAYVKDDSVNDLYQSLMTLDELGFDPVQKLQAANQVDAKTRRLNWDKGLDQDGPTVRKEVMNKLRSMKLTRPGTFFQPKGKSIVNEFYLQAEGEKIANALGRTGLFDNPDAVVSTVENILKTRYVVLGDRLVPRTQDMPQDMDKAWEWFHETRLKDLLKDTGIKPEQVEIRAVDRQNYGLFYKGIPELVPFAADKRFTLDKIHTDYRQWQIAEKTRPQRENWQKAIDKDFQPTNMPGSVYTIWQYTKDRGSLSPEQRTDLDKRFYPLAVKEHENAVASNKQDEAARWRVFMQAIQPE